MRGSFLPILPILPLPPLPPFYVFYRFHLFHLFTYFWRMKVTEELIDQILDQGENGMLDPSPYMESLKYLLLEDDDVDLTEEDHAYLIFLGTICLESLNRNGLYKDVRDEEMIFDMEDNNWETLENTDGNLDEFLNALREDFEEQDLLDFLAYSILPVDDDEDDSNEPVMSSEDAQILGFVRLKGLIDAILLPVV